MRQLTTRQRNLYLLFALLLFCGRLTAQTTGTTTTTAADQNFKTIPQQVKGNAENKATNKVNTVANNASNKVDTGLNNAYKGFVKMFRKKPKPRKDSTTATTQPPVNPANLPPGSQSTPPPY
jgi:hypothetical protein